MVELEELEEMVQDIGIGGAGYIQIIMALGVLVALEVFTMEVQVDLPLAMELVGAGVLVITVMELLVVIPVME
jgi:hypothetical protein